MTRIHDIVFFDPVEEIDMVGGGAMTLRVVGARRQDDRSADIEVQYGSHSALLRKFARRQLHPVGASQRTELLPFLYCVSSEKSPACAMLVGDPAVVLATEEGVREVLKLRRSENQYDPGFKHERLFPTPEGFLLIYESGASHIASDGRVLWSEDLYFDDVFERCDGVHLYYWSEATGSFRIDIRTGRRTPCSTGASA